MKQLQVSVQFVLCCHDPYFQQQQIYQKHHGQDLTQLLQGDTGGDYQALLLALIDGERDDEEPVSHDPLSKLSTDRGFLQVNEEEARDEARALYRAGEARTGTEEDVFIRVLTEHSFRQTRCILRHYNQVSEDRFLETKLNMILL